jgi:hypothetical protein
VTSRLFGDEYHFAPVEFMQRNRTDYCVVAEHVGAMKNRAFISVGIFMSASYNTPKQYGDEAMAAQFAQFAHIQTFSRKKNKAGQCVDQVIGELLREALYAAHVFEPAPPEVVDGISPEQLRAAHDAMVAAAQTQFRIKGEISPQELQRENFVFRGFRKDVIGFGPKHKPKSTPYLIIRPED